MPHHPNAQAATALTSPLLFCAAMFYRTRLQRTATFILAAVSLDGVERAG